MYERLKLAGRLGQVGDKSAGPPVLRELDVNALNFCRFAIASLEDLDEAANNGKRKEKEGILVVPSLLDSECVSQREMDCGWTTERRRAHHLGGRIPPSFLEATPLILQLRRRAQDAGSQLVPHGPHHVPTCFIASIIRWRIESQGRYGLRGWPDRALGLSWGL